MTAGLLAGATEAIAVVTPMEGKQNINFRGIQQANRRSLREKVVKIRLQAQHHSMADPLDIPK